MQGKCLNCSKEVNSRKAAFPLFGSQIKILDKGNDTLLIKRKLVLDFDFVIIGVMLLVSLLFLIFVEQGYLVASGIAPCALLLAFFKMPQEGIEISPKGLAFVKLMSLFGVRKFIPAKKIKYFELYEAYRQSRTANSGPKRGALYTKLRLVSYKSREKNSNMFVSTSRGLDDVILDRLEVEDKKWLQQYLTDYFFPTCDSCANK